MNTVNLIGQKFGRLTVIDLLEERNKHKRGITICDEWLHNFDVFYNWAINNGYNDKLTIDRIDNDKGYSPNNCRWTTIHEQHNNMRSNICLTYNNKTQTIAQWSHDLGVSRYTLYGRYKKGWNTKKVLFGKEN